MKKKSNIALIMGAISIFLSRNVYADIISPGAQARRSISNNMSPIVLVIVGIVVACAITALVVIGIKKDTKSNVEVAFGAVPKSESEDKKEGE